jgi:hypothetical protein
VQAPARFDESTESDCSHQFEPDVPASHRRRCAVADAPIMLSMTVLISCPPFADPWPSSVTIVFPSTAPAGLGPGWRIVPSARSAAARGSPRIGRIATVDGHGARYDSKDASATGNHQRQRRGVLTASSANERRR